MTVERDDETPEEPQAETLQPQPQHAHAPIGEEVDVDEVNKIMECIHTVDRRFMKENPDLVYFYVDEGNPGQHMVEVFKDLIDLDLDNENVPDREEIKALGGKFSVRWKPNPQPYTTCPFGVHAPEVCKCHLPVLTSGQDESAFKSFAQSSMEWTLGHDEGMQKRGLRKKGEGNGWMASGFQDEILGFGLPLSPDNLQALNDLLQSRNKPPLSMSPGLRTLEYGKNKEGYWTMQDMLKQLEEVMAAYEILFPEVQMCYLFDWSSGHSAMPPKALLANKMNTGFGGKQPEMRSTQIVGDQGFLGPYEPRLKKGDIQHMIFQPGDDPPWYAPQAPEKDTEEVQPDGTKKVVPGYLGKPKGLKQVKQSAYEYCTLPAKRSDPAPRFRTLPGAVGARTV